VGKRKQKNRRAADRRGVPGGPQASPRTTAALSVTVTLILLVAGGLWMGFTDPHQGSGHPDPRPGLTGSTVVPASRYAQFARVSAVYGQAAEIPSVLDGLYCHCDCAEHSGHRSLLTCFESDHAAACDICMSEAAIAYRMTKSGRSLEEIRAAIDELYGG